MEYVRLGRTGLKVSRICLGTNMFGADYVDEARAASVLDAAEECGINFIDTADVYNAGASESTLGRILKGRRSSFVVATKGFNPMGKGVNDHGLSRKHLIEAVEASLRRLDTDFIDLYQVHFWDPETPLEETMRTLDDLVRQGKIHYLGCSNFAAWQLCRALWVSDKHGLERFETVQPEYNLARRGIEDELLPLCLDQEVGVLPFQVFMGGILSGGYARSAEPPPNTHMTSQHAHRAAATYWSDTTFDTVERIKTLAADAGCEAAQLVLAWALAKPGITSVVAGASRPEQVLKNAAAAGLDLPGEFLAELDGL